MISLDIASPISFNDQHLEVVDCLKYQEVVLPKSRSFYQTKKHIVDQARKALFGLYRKIRNLELPIDCQLNFLIILLSRF